MKVCIFLIVGLFLITPFLVDYTVKLHKIQVGDCVPESTKIVTEQFNLTCGKTPNCTAVQYSFQIFNNSYLYFCEPYGCLPGHPDQHGYQAYCDGIRPTCLQYRNTSFCQDGCECYLRSDGSLSFISALTRGESALICITSVAMLLWFCAAGCHWVFNYNEMTRLSSSAGP